MAQNIAGGISDTVGLVGYALGGTGGLGCLYFSGQGVPVQRHTVVHYTRFQPQFGKACLAFIQAVNYLVDQGGAAFVVVGSQCLVTGFFQVLGQENQRGLLQNVPAVLIGVDAIRAEQKRLTQYHRGNVFFFQRLYPEINLTLAGLRSSAPK